MDRSRIEMIKELRSITGLGLMDCKNALDNAGGDIYKAIQNLGISDPKPEEAIYFIPKASKKFNNSKALNSRSNKGVKNKTGRRLFMKIEVKKDERVLLYKNGDFAKLLKPGTYTYSGFMGYSYETYKLDRAFMPTRHLNLYLDNEELASELEVIDVEDQEIVLHFEDKHFSQVLTQGRRAFWKGLVNHEFRAVSLDSPEIGTEFNRSLLKRGDMAQYVNHFAVESHMKGLLFFDEVYQKTLEPGQYSFWNGDKAVTIVKADMRQQQLDMTGQEIMTRDKVTIRLNFICHYKIVDPVKALIEIASYTDQLYIVMQLILREYVGTLTLDELLSQKEEIGQFVLAKLKEKVSGWGLEIIETGVKDIILPGEIRTILNQVIEAEKKAQANIIMRREETASTRSLLNTAKLMEDNPTLMKLKELEHIEKITDRINHLSVVGGGQLLDQLVEIFKPSNRT